MRTTGQAQGFTYRALPGHPEQGEETFEAAIAPDGTVTFALHAQSRPGAWWARLGSPVTEVMQRRFTLAYLDAARQLARSRTA